MIRYAITDGSRVEGAGARWAAAGVDYVQLRAKDVDAGELMRRARALLQELRGTQAKLLVNGRLDVAMASGADGVHLTATPDELTVAQVRRLMPGVVVSLSCHTLQDVKRVRDGGADLILYGPVFEKRIDEAIVQDGVGLRALAEAVRVAAPVKVLALGGVTNANANACVETGAAGVAAIRLFA